MTMDYRVEKWSGSSRPEARELTDRLRSEGYDVLQWADPSGTVYADHEHSEEQSHWIISGTLELTIRGFGTIRLGPGDRDHMPAGTIHSARVIGNESVVYLIGSKT